MSDYRICAPDDVPENGHVLVELEGKQVAVFDVNGEYRAYTNWCPHQSGPVCEGRLDGTVERTFDRETLAQEYRWVREHEVLRCPWHAWEFDALTGRCLHDETIQLISHDVSVEDGMVTVSL